MQMVKLICHKDQDCTVKPRTQVVPPFVLAFLDHNNAYGSFKFCIKPHIIPWEKVQGQLDDSGLGSLVVLIINRTHDIFKWAIFKSKILSTYWFDLKLEIHDQFLSTLKSRCKIQLFKCIPHFSYVAQVEFPVHWHQSEVTFPLGGQEFHLWT